MIRLGHFCHRISIDVMYRSLQKRLILFLRHHYVPQNVIILDHTYELMENIILKVLSLTIMIKNLLFLQKTKK